MDISKPVWLVWNSDLLFKLKFYIFPTLINIIPDSFVYYQDRWNALICIQLIMEH